MASNPRHHVSRLAFLFSCPQKYFNKPFEFLLYKTNRLHFSVCVYCNRSQETSQRVKNNNHATRLRLVSYFFVLYTYCSTHTRKNVIYLLNTNHITNEVSIMLTFIVPVSGIVYGLNYEKFRMTLQCIYSI